MRLPHTNSIFPRIRSHSSASRQNCFASHQIRTASSECLTRNFSRRTGQSFVTLTIHPRPAAPLCHPRRASDSRRCRQRKCPLSPMSIQPETLHGEDRCRRDGHTDSTETATRSADAIPQRASRSIFPRRCLRLRDRQPAAVIDADALPARARVHGRLLATTGHPESISYRVLA